MFVDRVGDWSALGKSLGVVTCVKPHRGGGMSRPSEAVWLIDQIGDVQWLKMVYDYSHYAFRDIPLIKSVQESLPHIGHVAVKDAVQTTSKDGKNSRVEFQLPGEAGTIDRGVARHVLRSGVVSRDLHVPQLGRSALTQTPAPPASTRCSRCWSGPEPAIESDYAAREHLQGEPP